MKGLCGRRCSQCLLYEDCGGCSLCEASLCKGGCDICFSLCFKRPAAAAYLMSIGGAKLNLQQNRKLSFPVHIPILPDRLKIKPQHNLMPVVGIHGGNMFARNGEKINNSYLQKGFTAALNIDEKTEGILQFYVPDRTLEGFWDNRQAIYSDLKKMNFSGIISPNFSVYEDAPRVDHLYNMKRTSIVYNEMLDIGLPAILDVSWYNKSDLERWCSAIKAFNVKTIAFSFQVVDVALKASDLWKSYILGFRYLCKNISKDTNILIVGAVSRNKIEEIFKASRGQKLHILNQSAFVQSRRGISSETRKARSDLSFDELLLQNVMYFNNTYKTLFKEIQTEKD
ncbi:MAG: DUF4417 domain-containing protein [Thermotaleaceae bacterium]